MTMGFLKGKTVLVTGGTGSFGRQFVTKVLQGSACKKIIVFSRDELKQHEMKQELDDQTNRLRFFIGDVRDLPRLERAFAGVDIVVHAAALKQVPALEYNPLEAIKTNILGTQNVIDAALDNEVEKVLLVSTDKAVNPISLYGATKLSAEKLCVASNAYGKTVHPTIFSVVRYGNVIGSRGSIVEMLRNQKKSASVPLTHEEMTRFWITIDAGIQLVFDALRLMKGGEIFVPKLPTMKVKDLIRALAPRARIEIVGIRPGEKMHEMLLTEDEVRYTKDIGDYYLVEPSHNWWNGSHLKMCKSLPHNFVYASNTGSFLSIKEFLKYL